MDLAERGRLIAAEMGACGCCWGQKTHAHFAWLPCSRCGGSGNEPKP